MNATTATTSLARRTSRLALLLAACLAGVASEALDDELAHYHETAAKLEKAYSESLAKEKSHSLATLVPLAKRDAAGASEVWKLVLTLDPQQEDARKFFAGLGQLDAVLAEIAAHDGILIGKGETTTAKAPPDPRLDMTGAKLIKIQSLAGQGTGIGNLKAGTVILIQYVSGKWNAGGGAAGTPQSPDAADTSPRNRLDLVQDSGNEPIVLATVPAGTADTPFLFTLPKAGLGMTLRISESGARARTYEGEVQYRVKVIPPGR